MTLADMGKKKKENLVKGISYAVLIIWVLITLVPIIFTVLTAFKTDPEISMASFKWLPESFGNIESFRQAFAMGDWFQYFKNSLFITAVTVVGSLIFNSMAGYAFARLKFKGREFLFMSVLLGMMVSPSPLSYLSMS